MAETLPTDVKSQDPKAKLLLEMGPLMLFFLANSKPQWFLPTLSYIFGESFFANEKAPIFAATAIFMAAITISLVISYFIYKKLAVMPLVSGIVVVVFGSLTLFLQDDTFIKMKPTIVNLLFGLLLIGGLAFKKTLLTYVFDEVFKLDEAGWHKITLNWGIFFLFLAGLNEVIWRTQSTDFWVAFKVWGTMPLTILFTFMQIPLIMKHGSLRDKE